MIRNGSLGKTHFTKLFSFLITGQTSLITIYFLILYSEVKTQVKLPNMGKKSFAPANGDSETTLPADDIEYNAATNKQKNKGDDVKLSDLSSSSSSEKSYPV